MGKPIANQALGTSNVIEAIKTRATALGISMNRMCREVGVDHSKITRWKRKEPSAITYLRKIDKYLTDKEAEI